MNTKKFIIGVLVTIAGLGIMGDAAAATVPLPVAVISAAPKSGPAPLTVSFDGSGCRVTDRQNYYIIGYDWCFGDGSDTSHENMVQHTYVNPGTYVVSLAAVQNANDWSVTYQRGLTVYDTIKVAGAAGVNPGNLWPSARMQDVVDHHECPSSVLLNGRLVTPAGKSHPAGLLLRQSRDGKHFLRLMKMKQGR